MLCESWCLKAESISLLRNWYNKHIREMCFCVIWVCISSSSNVQGSDVSQPFAHQISSASLQKRTGVYLIENYLASRTLLWFGHVTRTPRSGLSLAPNLHSSGYTQMACSHDGGPCEDFEIRWRTTRNSDHRWKIHGFSSMIGRGH